MASGNTLLTVDALGASFPAANYPTHDQRNNHPVLDFDATTEEACYFEGILPRNYAGGGLTVYLHFAMTSAVANGIVLGVSFERIGDGIQDLDADGFASEKTTGTVTVPGTSGNVKIASIAFTNGAEIDSLAVGERFRIKVARKVADAGDTATGDLELVAVEIKET
jgi:hypothetical protein